MRFTTALLALLCAGSSSTFAQRFASSTAAVSTSESSLSGSNNSSSSTVTSSSPINKVTSASNSRQTSSAHSGNGGENPFVTPSVGSHIRAGKETILSWNKTTEGTVTLVLRAGSADNLLQGDVIAASIPNTGRYAWTPNPKLASGNEYTIEIVADGIPNIKSNFSPRFSIKSSGTSTLGSGGSGGDAQVTGSADLDGAPFSNSSMTAGGSNHTTTTKAPSKSSHASKTAGKTSSASQGTAVPSSGASVVGMGKGGLFSSLEAGGLFVALVGSLGVAVVI